MKRIEVFNRSFVSFLAMLGASWLLVGAIYEKTGFYAGLSAGAGYNSGKFYEKARMQPASFSIPDRSSIHYSGPAFCGFFGYTTPLFRKDWLAGIEFGIEKPFYKKQFQQPLIREDIQDPIQGNCKYQIKDVYITKLHAKLGKIINRKWFVYGLTGIDVKEVKISERATYLDAYFGDDTKKFLCGFAVGFGFEKEIGKNWRLGLEFVNTIYPSKSINHNNHGLYINSELRTNSTQIALRLVHNF